MADLAGALGVGADHEARGVAQGHDGQIVGVAQLEEPRRFVRSVGVDGATEVGGIVGHDADRAAFDTGQRRHHAGAEPGPQLQYRTRVGQDADQRSDVVGAHAFLGNSRAQ